MQVRDAGAELLSTSLMSAGFQPASRPSGSRADSWLKYLIETKE